MRQGENLLAMDRNSRT